MTILCTTDIEAETTMRDLVRMRDKPEFKYTFSLFRKGKKVIVSSKRFKTGKALLGQDFWDMQAELDYCVQGIRI